MIYRLQNLLVFVSIDIPFILADTISALVSSLILAFYRILIRKCSSFWSVKQVKGKTFTRFSREQFLCI